MKIHQQSPLTSQNGFPWMFFTNFFSANRSAHGVKFCWSTWHDKAILDFQFVCHCWRRQEDSPILSGDFDLVVYNHVTSTAWYAYSPRKVCHKAQGPLGSTIINTDLQFAHLNCVTCSHRAQGVVSPPGKNRFLTRSRWMSEHALAK